MKTRTATDMARGDLIAKDMSVMREHDSANIEHKMSHMVIRDYSLSHRVEIDWDLNVEAHRDRIFKLKVGDRSVLIDAEELLRAIRWV